MDQGDGEVAGAVLPRGTTVVCGMTAANRDPSLELAVPVGQLREQKGLAVGGLRELPVRW
ncbi:hypothetical protein [Streptomyces sp. NPDC059455]|uniref:hypothetical protein n=1 Tax=Streptomyces sp. NPDC059455 TaxID=3346837 RepID=UPI0036B48BA0